ncbi:alpha/beta fold hydrolase [Ornithinibacillus scapharcae]|uniref:alpha/beta fold hydrolase n=1 Tax=Ornithinibacillus scapharcae TaxID=1147159 RepID=UPI000225AE25|nr:alpha/beta hydrolase [Ornithinibacillus scapharcae]
MEFSSTSLKLQNTNIYCEYLLQDKPTIFLIHGFVASSYTFNQLKPLLAENFSVIAIDLPGFGKSEKSISFTYSFENYAKLVLECLDYFRIGEAVVAGHSMGGQIALYTGLKAPERVKKLVLCCSSGYLPRAKKHLIYSTYLPFFHLIAKKKINSQSVVNNLRNVFYDHSLITEDQIEEYGRPLQDKNFPKSLIRLLRHREGDLTSVQLRNIHTPTLLLWGEQDKVVPLVIGKKLAKDLPNSRLISYDKAGHLVTEEKPMEIYKEILSFTKVEEKKNS